MACRARITVRGLVQGVGFRPYVYRLARSLGLAGMVANTIEGAVIDVEGETLDEFLALLPQKQPPLCRIQEVAVEYFEVKAGYSGFHIEKSIDGAAPAFTVVAADTAPCDACMSELFDPADRRYLYPFINCTDCGPRYTIISSVPYDRSATSMASFILCKECREEYENPGSRRFHAQPNACPLCGPRVELVGGKRAVEEEALAQTVRLLLDGAVIAVKGLGGFHLACDARNADAVARLRARKRKSNKPFALMVPAIEYARRICFLSERETSALLSPRRPIVLARKRQGSLLPDSVAPGNDRYGVMLPYTPLHHLLFFFPLRSGQRVGTPHFESLVMTSGNISEEPVIGDNDEALAKLSPLADAFLIHNRDIVNRADDSVVQVRPGGDVLFLRRARGYVPEPEVLNTTGPDVVAAGGDLKNTFTLVRDVYAITGPHIGDRESYESLRFFEDCLARAITLYRARPQAVAYDLHPGYHSTRWALDTPIERKIPVQHHHAHLCSVLAEYGIHEEVIGIVLDGTGYGTDGTLWGGEILLADPCSFTRFAHFAAVPLPGGEAAAKEPWRCTVSYLVCAVGQGRALDILERLEGSGFMYQKEAVERILKIMEARTLSPLSSSAGRLFDAVSALLGLCSVNTFEAEAAMALEAVAREEVEERYAFRRSAEGVIDFSEAIAAMAEEVIGGRDKGEIAAGFHNTIVAAVAEAVFALRRMSGIGTVALSGGCFQNAFLLEGTVKVLEDEGMVVCVNRKVPPNDGGLSLGQAWSGRERMRRQGNTPDPLKGASTPKPPSKGVSFVLTRGMV